MTATEVTRTATTTATGSAGIGYDSAGQGEPHLLFVHGWCGDRSFFAPQFQHFAPAHRVVSVDLPGHGTSLAPDAYTIEALAAEVVALGRELGLGRGILVSHSLGSMVGLAVAEQAPDLVSAQIMVDPPPLSKDVWKDFAASLLTGFEGPEPGESRRKFVEQMFLPTDDAQRRASIVQAMCAAPDDVAIATTKAMAAFDPGAALRAASVPVLVIASAVPTNSPEYLHELNPGVITGQTVGAGHFLQLEIPDQVNLMIERFLAVS